MSTHKQGFLRVYADFRLSAEQIAAGKATTEDGEKHEPSFGVDVTGAPGKVIATVGKTLRLRRAAAPAASATLTS